MSIRRAARSSPHSDQPEVCIANQEDTRTDQLPSSVLSTNRNRTATIFYALTMMLIGLLFAVLWAYASGNNRLIDAHLDKQQRRREFLRPLMTVAIFLLSIGIVYRFRPGEIIVGADLAHLPICE